MTSSTGVNGTAAEFFETLDVAGSPRALVALGGRLDVPTLVAAYRAGCFPWPATGAYKESLEESARQLAGSGEVPVLPGTDEGAVLVPWLSPDPRPVLMAETVHIARSLRRQMRSCGWETTVDVAFEAVLAACAERDSTWITDPVRPAYTDLHRAGTAHSVEVWAGDELVGGLYGVLTGRVFSGESMFHRATGASKVAVVDLCDRLVSAGAVLIDTEEQSEHMEQLGQVSMSRDEYLERVHRLRDREPRWPSTAGRSHASSPEETMAVTGPPCHDASDVTAPAPWHCPAPTVSRPSR